MFTVNHFIWLGISIILITGLLILSLKLKLNKHQAISIMCIISILSELCKVFSHIKYVNGVDWTEGGVITPNALPLHLCSLFIFVFFFLFFNKNEKIEKHIISFFVPIGIVAATLALLLATSGVEFNKPQPYQCFIYHSAMVYLALYFIVTKQVTITFKDMMINIVVLFALSIVMIWVNGAFRTYDTNFFFVVRPPADNLPFLNLNDGWYAYYFRLLLTGLLLEIIFSIPYLINGSIKETNK